VTKFVSSLRLRPATRCDFDVPTLTRNDRRSRLGLWAGMMSFQICLLTWRSSLPYDVSGRIRARHDNAGMAAGRICADVTQTAVQRDEDSSGRGGCRDDVVVWCAD